MQLNSSKYPPLAFKPYSLNLRTTAKNQVEVFDEIRKTWLLLTPEEWVRQHMIYFLIQDKNVPVLKIAVEYEFKYNRRSKRADIVVFNEFMQAVLIVECKAASVSISQDVFFQIAQYNRILKVPYLVVTNGLKNYACKVQTNEPFFEFIQELPNYSELIQQKPLA